MIKNTELRIGNWVTNQKGDFSGTPVGKPKQITADDFVFANLFLPIPLSPEILEQSGFNWETDAKTHLAKDMTPQSDMMFFFKNGIMEQIQFYNSEGFGNYRDKPPQYVHQLQNLYFALTGEELEVKGI